MLVRAFADARVRRAAGIAAVVAAAGALSACTSISRSLGVAKVTPDEFRVVSKAPLVVPPDYALRPPAPGEPRPQELAPESAARNVLLGRREDVTRTEGERLLVAKSGADKADPLVRYVVDDEFGDLAHKETSFADRVMFWRKDKPETQAPGAVTAAAAGAQTPAPIDPEAESKRVATTTGGAPIVIRRESTSRIKLPGL